MMEQSSKISLGQVFGFLWKSFQFMDGQKGRYGLGAVCSFIELGTVYLMPLFISRMIAVIQEGASLWPLLVIFILFLVAAPLIAMGNYWMGTASYHGLCNMKKAVFAHMQQLPMSNFDGKASGEYLSRVSIDADKAGGMFRGYAIVGLFKFCVYETVGIFVLSLMDFRLVLIAALLCLIALFFTLFFNPRVRRLEAEGKTGTEKLMSLINEAVNGHLVIKLFPVRGQVEKKYDRQSGEVYRTKAQFRYINGIGYALVDFFSLYLQPVGLAAAVALLAGGEITAAQAVLAATVMGIMGQGTKEFNAFMQYIQSGIVSAERLFSFLESKDVEMEDNPDEKQGTPDLAANLAIRFSGVHFSYTGKDPVLRDLSLDIRNGASVALVGDSGSGKSTMLKLMMGFYQADSGRIEIFGREQKEYAPQKLRRLCSYVPQMPALVEGTIRDNLIMGNPEGYRQEEVENAVRLAGLDDFVHSLKDGLDTKLGARGMQLSGGQRQRLAIARAILEDAPVVLMDEATSALDSETEAEILKNIRKIFRGKTVIVSAHRLYTVEHSDQIFVMRKGRLEGQGTHEELLRSNDCYRELCGSAIR